MKILLLNDSEHFWPLVVTYLKDINARGTVIATEEDLESSLEEPPALIITGRRLAAHALVAASRAPLIIISMAGDTSDPGSGRARRKSWQLTWPLSRRVFLETTSAALGIEPRREFRSIMRVIQDGDRETSLVESLDFSESGLGFLSKDYFALGSKLTLSMSLPGLGKSLQLNCRIMRDAKTDGDRGWVYGAEFLDLDYPKRKLLHDFILS